MYTIFLLKVINGHLLPHCKSRNSHLASAQLSSLRERYKLIRYFTLSMIIVKYITEYFPKTQIFLDGGCLLAKVQNSMN